MEVSHANAQVRKVTLQCQVCGVDSFAVSNPTDVISWGLWVPDNKVLHNVNPLN